MRVRHQWAFPQIFEGLQEWFRSRGQRQQAFLHRLIVLSQIKANQYAQQLDDGRLQMVVPFVKCFEQNRQDPGGEQRAQELFSSRTQASEARFVRMEKPLLLWQPVAQDIKQIPSISRISVFLISVSVCVTQEGEQAISDLFADTLVKQILYEV